jgi:hypothetical protein
MLPFRKIYGIELSDELAKAAANFRRDARVEILHGDARTLVPADLDIAYFFNPFPEPVLVDVLERLGGAHARSRHPVPVPQLRLRARGAALPEHRRAPGVQRVRRHPLRDVPPLGEASDGLKDALARSARLPPHAPVVAM